MANKESLEIYDLLVKIDNGYEPTAEENDILANLQELDFFNTQITELPEAIGRLSNLQKLYLSNTQITELPEAVGKLANLQWLYLSKTQITELPEAMGNLAKLQTLVLSGTQITALPLAMGSLVNLLDLNLSYTNITELPNAVGNLVNLKWLDLSGTKITELPNTVDRLVNLKWLFLGYNHITELPDAVGKMTKLQRLDLSYTKITEVPEAVGRLENLQRLNLNGTQITEVPEFVGELPKLDYLFLEHLNLDSLPDSLLTGSMSFYDRLYLFRQHKGIFIHNTTIKNIPTSALLQSQKVRIRQFGSGTKQAMNEAKIIFLGDGEVGKSYTIKRILNGGKRETKDEYKTSTTHGVRIEDYRPEGKKLLVHLWDFGGQEIMHSMHRCFLTENTGYVVMVDTRKPGQTARARYWLQNVKSIAPHAPVILVLNLWDSREAIGDLDAPKLIGQFGNDLEITVVKCSAMYSDQEEFLELMRMIGDMAETVEQRMGSFAAEYIEIKNSLKKEYDKKPYISVEEFDKICRSHKVKESDDLANWFNELGICFSYRDKNKKRFTSYNLLQPKWLTNAIYAIIMEGRHYAQKGRITRQAIYDFLKVPEPEKSSGEPHTRIEPNITYEAYECDYVLDVAKSFNLVYEDDEALFFPAMLESETPDEIVAETKTKTPDMRYRLEYEFLPDTVIHQLMVECRKHAITLETCWLRGMKATAIDGLSALVQMTEDNKTLEIDVYGEGEIKAHTMFKILRERLTEINGRLNMKCKDFILAPDGERFEIARLETEKRLGNTQIVGGGGRVYNLEDLGIDLPAVQDRKPQEPIYVEVHNNTPTPAPNPDLKPQKKSGVEKLKDISTIVSNFRWIIVPIGAVAVVWILHMINPTLAQKVLNFFKELFKNKGLGG